jgi:hypothetical protein
MKFRLILILSLGLVFSCNNKSSIERPNIDQSVNYISQKINDNELIGTNGVYRNIYFGVTNGKVRSTYDYYSERYNHHYRVTQYFFLKNINFVNTNYFDGVYYIRLDLDKINNHRFIESLNELPVSDYGLNEEEFIDSAYLRVSGADKDGISKAFENIVTIMKEESGENYFEN